MRHLLTLFLACVLSGAALAQARGTGSQLPAQFKKLITDAATNFVHFRGDKVKEAEADVIYASNINLEGTTENQVLHFSSGHSYLAKIGETRDARAAKALVESWKKKVLAIVGPGYEVMADNPPSEESVQHGYLLLSDKVSISIHSIQYKDEETINVYLIIMNL